MDLNNKNMKAFFKKLLSNEAVQEDSFTDVMEVVPRRYPQVVQDIHNEFMNAGERLLQQANQIICSIVIKDEDKAVRLKELGFSSVAEVKHTEAQIAKKAEQERISRAILDYRVEYPNHKFITEDAVKIICNKYGLVLGLNSQFKGFVPQKNLLDIENFFKQHEEDKYQYVIQYYGGAWGIHTTKITKEQYEKNIEYKQLLRKRDSKSDGVSRLAISSNEHYTKIPATLNICAPLKDMNTEGHRLQGHVLVKEVPDPIVLLPKKHSNGTSGYIIITAWGDEASDPLVINHNNN